jgi:hypothetical protein
MHDCEIIDINLKTDKLLRQCVVSVLASNEQRAIVVDN